MPPKRKNPFAAPSYGSQNARKNPRLRKGDETEEPPVNLSDPSSLPPRVIEGVHKAVEEKVEHGKKLVSRALKKAKGFEKQKLVKRLKIAREKNEDASVKKLELEFEVLKTEEIDLNSLASNHILKTLSKSRPISSSLLFPPWIVSQKEPEGQLDERETAKRNIIARLYNSNPVKEEMVLVLGNVRRAMGMDQGDTKVEKVEQKSGNDNIQAGGGEGGSDQDKKQDQGVSKTIHGFKLNTTAEASTDKNYEGVEEWGGISDAGVSGDVEMDLDAFTADFEDRVAGSSDEDEDQGPLQRRTDDEWSGEEDVEPQPTETTATQILSDPNSKSGSELRPDDAAPAPTEKSKPSAKSQPVSSATSTFLPTLMSGYISGSDSDVDADYYKDKKGKKKGPAEPKERKNRMGQQARRALWEKKFGKNANHVKKEEAEQGRKKIEQRINQGKGRGGKTSDGAEKKRKKSEVEGLLHPSWEAARKAKEQQVKIQEAVMGKPMGKKIVFD